MLVGVDRRDGTSDQRSWLVELASWPGRKSCSILHNSIIRYFKKSTHTCIFIIALYIGKLLCENLALHPEYMIRTSTLKYLKAINYYCRSGEWGGEHRPVATTVRAKPTPKPTPKLTRLTRNVDCLVLLALVTQSHQCLRNWNIFVIVASCCSILASHSQLSGVS